MPLFKVRWVFTERFLKGKTYKARDLGTGEERQHIRDQFKMVNIPPEYEPWPKPVSPTGAAVRDLEGVSDGKPEPVV